MNNFLMPQYNAQQRGIINQFAKQYGLNPFDLMRLITLVNLEKTAVNQEINDNLKPSELWKGPRKEER